MSSSQPHPAKRNSPVPRDQLHQPSNGARKGSKKNGGGGRHTWGRVGDEYQGSPASLDRGDPNFDEEDERSKTVYVASEA